MSVPLCDKDAEKITQMGSQLSEVVKHQLSKFRRENYNLFAWSAAYMPGISHAMINHRLDVDPRVKSVKQKKRKYSEDKFFR